MNTSNYDIAIAAAMPTAYIVGASISFWEPKKVNPKVAKAAAAALGMEAKYISGKLTLMEDPVLQALARVRDEARQYYWNNTLPYKIRGLRILPDMLDEFIATMNGYGDEMARLAAELASGWDQRVLSQKAVQTGVADVSQYPRAEDIAARFGIELAQPSPLYLSGEDMPKLWQSNPDFAAQMMDDARVQLAAGMRDIWVRLETSLDQIVERVGGAGRFHDGTTVMAELGDIVKLLPKLNITSDPELNRLADELSAKVLLATDAQLKGRGKDDAQRAEIADAARAALSKVKGRIHPGAAPIAKPKAKPAAPQPVAQPVAQPAPVVEPKVEAAPPVTPAPSAAPQVKRKVYHF